MCGGFRRKPNRTRRPRQSPTPAGWPPTTTKISTSSASCFRKRLHQDFYNVYSYCRWADDLGDEMGDRAESLRLLAWWRERIRRHVRRARDAPGLRRAACPPFEKSAFRASRSTDLVHAFVQDQTVTRYQDWDELFGYCLNSANPVGRLVLYLCGYSRRRAPAAFRLRPAPRCSSPISGRT